MWQLNSQPSLRQQCYIFQACDSFQHSGTKHGCDGGHGVGLLFLCVCVSLLACRATWFSDAFTWAQQACCPSCLLHSVSHLRWNHQYWTVPYCSAHIWHWENSFALSTFQILYKSTSWRQARWQQTIFNRPFLCPCVCSTIQIVALGLDGHCALLCYQCVIFVELLPQCLYLYLELLRKGGCSQYWLMLLLSLREK